MERPRKLKALQSHWKGVAFNEEEPSGKHFRRTECANGYKEQEDFISWHQMKPNHLASACRKRGSSKV